MPTRRIGVTFWPRKMPPSCAVNHDCGTWRRWKSSIAPAAVVRASRNSVPTSATALSISARVTRNSAMSRAVELLGVLANGLVTARANVVDDALGNAENLGVHPAAAPQVGLAQTLASGKLDPSDHLGASLPYRALELGRASDSIPFARHQRCQRVGQLDDPLVQCAERPDWRRSGPCLAARPRRSEPFCRSVVPVAVMSTMTSAIPMSGASSMLPFSFTISTWTPFSAKCCSVMRGYLVATRSTPRCP